MTAPRPSGRRTTRPRRPSNRAVHGADRRTDGDQGPGRRRSDACGSATQRARGSRPATWQGPGRGARCLNTVPSRRARRTSSARRSRRPSPTDNRLVVGKTPGVTADDHVAEAGRKVMRFHLARMLAREAGTREGKDPEELHAMRVATRRQRAAWRVFGASFRPGRTKRYRRGLREIASRLGTVRDLDVLLEAADAYRADLPVSEQRALEPLLADWRQHRDDARVLLIRELDSDGYRRWVDDYRDFVRTEGVALMPGRSDPAASRPRYRPVADLGGVRAGPRLRAGPALGRCRDAPRAAHRREVAALHARIRPRGAGRRRGAADRHASPRSRTTSG